MTDMYKENKKIHYKCIKFGDNLSNKSYNTKKLHSLDDCKEWTRQMKMDNIKGGYIVLTTTYAEVESYVTNGSLHLIDSTHRTATNDYIDNKHTLSGMILLGIISLQKPYRGKSVWNSTHHKIMAKHKTTVITSDKKHHSSLGMYYSYGNKANFGQTDLSSIGQYASKRNNLDSHVNDLCIEELSQSEIQISIKQLSMHLPLLRKLLSPIVSTANRIQSTVGSINLKQTSASEEGIWQTCMCVNAQTTEFHTEMDCTYTLIHVPSQEPEQSAGKYNFVFQLSPSMNISIHMKAGLSFMFSGKFLTHRQSCDKDGRDSTGTFINFASYGNARLYRHIRNSFERVKEFNKFKDIKV